MDTCSIETLSGYYSCRKVRIIPALAAMANIRLEDEGIVGKAGRWLRHSGCRTELHRNTGSKITLPTMNHNAFCSRIEPRKGMINAPSIPLVKCVH